jgi:hypothetical protein
MIRGETRLSASEMGMLLSAFSTAYGLSQIPIACCLTPSEDEARNDLRQPGMNTLMSADRLANHVLTALAAEDYFGYQI